MKERKNNKQAKTVAAVLRSLGFDDMLVVAGKNLDAKEGEVNVMFCSSAGPSSSPEQYVRLSALVVVAMMSEPILYTQLKAAMNEYEEQAGLNN